jgi:hypothetical protein
VFVGVITTLYNSGATDLANILGIVYPVLLAIIIFGLGIYQLYRTYIVDEVDKMDLNTYIQDYTFAGKEYNVNDTDATAIDKKRVQKAYENWMKKSELGRIYEKDQWKVTSNDQSSNLISDVSFVAKFNDKYYKASPTDIILPETSADLKNKYIKLVDLSYINLDNESASAASARQYYFKLKKEVDIEDDSYLDETKARYAPDTTSSYTNMNGISSIQGYSNIDGFTNYN